jgi:ABC-type transport system involved in multi-copper enzyme maturation permease subunit
MKNILLFARFTLEEATAKRLVLSVVLLTLVFIVFFLLGVYFLEQRFTERLRDLGSARVRATPAEFVGLLLVMGMYVCNLLGVLMGGLSSVASLSGEIESGTILTLVPKPVRRAEIVLGRWLGFSLLTVAYLTALSGLILLGVWWIGGYVPPDPVRAVLLMNLGALTVVSLAVLGSAVLSTLANGITVAVVYGLSWVGGLLEAIGRATDTPVLVTMGDLSKLIAPNDTLWKGASYHLQPELLLAVSRQARGGSNPFLGTNPATLETVAWAFAYITLTVALAVIVFNRRDL